MWLPYQGRERILPAGVDRLFTGVASLVVFSQLHEVAEVDLAAGAPRHCLTFDAFCEMASREKSGGASIET